MERNDQEDYRESDKTIEVQAEDIEDAQGSFQPLDDRVSQDYHRQSNPHVRVYSRGCGCGGCLMPLLLLMMLLMLLNR